MQTRRGSGAQIEVDTAAAHDSLGLAGDPTSRQRLPGAGAGASPGRRRADPAARRRRAGPQVIRVKPEPEFSGTRIFGFFFFPTDFGYHF